MLNRIRQFVGASALRRNIGMTLARQLLAAFSQLLLVVLIARELGPEGNGYYAIAVLISTMLAKFLNFGVGPATVYYVSRGDFSIEQAWKGNCRLAIVVATGGLVFIFPVFWVWGKGIFPGVPASLVYLGLASFPLTLLLAYLSTILQGLQDFKAFNLTVLVPPYVNLAGVAIAFYFLECGVIGALVAFIIGQIVGLLIVLRLLAKRRSFKTTEEATTTSFYARRVLGYGWKAHLSNILTYVNYRADMFLVNFFLSPAATGIYVIAVQIAEKLWMLSQAASTVLLPRLSAMHQQPTARLALAHKGFWVVTALTAGASVFVAATLLWLIKPVFGQEYIEALPAFFWLLPGIIAGAGSRIYSNCIAAAGRPEWNMYASLSVMAINVIGNVVLIPDHGLVGAAWATSFAYCLNALIRVLIVKRI
ncbi:flippase [Marinobacter bohaiensis]|uniref:flippase n=1 Tax=Marinobacter bohaiensis TaxID=2201898 RepID=UPI0013A6E2C0|nr:flippase [Marinobacter bohaiensis]